MTAHIQLKLFASLGRFTPPHWKAVAVTPGQTVQDVLLDLGVPLDDVQLVFVDGVKGDLTTMLQGGERIGVFPPVGGG
jgi:molybdopterin converting factor small subunit